MADVPPELNQKDLIVAQSIARQEFVEIPGEYRLRGMTRQMTASERVALSWLRGVMVVLNSKGAFREGFLEAFVEPLELPDSEPDAEYHDWVENEEKKKP